MKKVYIAGKITGLPYDEVVKRFNEAEEQILDHRCIAINPTKIVPPGTDWNKALRICIKALVGCDAIALLPDWEDSEGAIFEVMVATKLGLRKIKL